MVYDIWLVFSDHLGMVFGSILLSVLTLIHGVVPGILFRWRTKSKADRELAHEAHVAMLAAVKVIKTQTEQIKTIVPVILELQRESQTMIGLLTLVSERGPRDIQHQIADVQKTLSGLRALPEAQNGPVRQNFDI